MEREEKEYIVTQVLKDLEQMHILTCGDYYRYYNSYFETDRHTVKKAISKLRTIADGTHKKDKFSNLTDFIVMIYKSQDCNVKKTLSTLADLDINISDKQLRNILAKEGVYKTGRKNSD